LTNHPIGTLGVFVTTIGYSPSSITAASKSSYDILLTNLSNVTKDFTSYINKRKKGYKKKYNG